MSCAPPAKPVVPPSYSSCRFPSAVLRFTSALQTLCLGLDVAPRQFAGEQAEKRRQRAGLVKGEGYGSAASHSRNDSVMAHGDEADVLVGP